MIKGFHCPAGKGDVSFNECLKCAASHKNTCQFDYPILSAMVKNIRKDEAISVTSLINCLRKVVLQIRKDYYLDPRELYYAFRGQLFHTVIAEAQTCGAICEKRFERSVSGIVLSGHPDVIYPYHRKIVDYKSTRRIPKDNTPYGGHSIQVNLYRYLVEPKYEVDKLEIVYFDMSSVKRINVEVMDEKNLLRWLVPRIEKLKVAFNGGKLPERVGPDGLWQCNGYCPFTKFCWPEGVPSLKNLEENKKVKGNSTLKATGGRR